MGENEICVTSGRERFKLLEGIRRTAVLSGRAQLFTDLKKKVGGGIKEWGGKLVDNEQKKRCNHDLELKKSLTFFLSI